MEQITMKKLLLSVITTASLLSSTLASSAAAAGTASFSLSPASGSYAQGSSFTVTVRETGDNVNAVTAKLTYDATKLTCTGVSTTGSDFAASSGANCGSGNITIGRYVGLDDTTGNPNPAKNGSQVVGTVSFTAVAATGTTAVNFAAGSQIAADGANIWNGSTTGGSYTLTAAPVATQPSNPTQPTSGGSLSSSTPTSSTGTKTGTGTGTTTPTSASTGSSTTTATPAPTTTQSKGHKIAKPAPKRIKSHHAGVVTSALALVVVAAGLYWLVIRKRTEVAPVKTAYKLDTTSKSKTASASKGKKPASHSTVGARKTTAKSKATATKKKA